MTDRQTNAEIRNFATVLLSIVTVAAEDMLPAALVATHVYRPWSAAVSPLIVNIPPSLENLLEGSGTTTEPLGNAQLYVGLGLPVAMHSKVAVPPWTTSTSAGR